jgi:ferredoxin
VVRYVKLQVATEICDQHGQCVLAAPGLFRFDEAGELVYVEEAPASLEEAARRAALLCPTRAIKTTP